MSNFELPDSQPELTTGIDLGRPDSLNREAYGYYDAAGADAGTSREFVFNEGEDVAREGDQSQAEKLEQLEEEKAEQKLVDRKPEDVNSLEIRYGRKEGDAEANYVIEKDGKVRMLRSPDKGLFNGDGTIVIEIDDSAGDMARAAMAAQKSSLVALVSKIESQYKNANRSPLIPPDLLAALDSPGNIPAPRIVERVVGGSHSSGWGPRGGNRGGNGSVFRPGSIPRLPSSGDSPSLPGDSGVKPGRAPAYDFSKLGGLDMENPVDRVVALVSANEGKPTTINWNDNGAGISVGLFQANQRKGELPLLLDRMYEKNPDLFNMIFKEQSVNMRSDRFVRNAHFSRNNRLGRMMQEAINQPEFQKVQLDMMREKVAHASDVAKGFGITSTLGVALTADLINQLGEGDRTSGARRHLRAALRHSNESDKIRAVVRSSETNRWRHGRFNKIASAGLVSSHEKFSLS